MGDLKYVKSRLIAEKLLSDELDVTGMVKKYFVSFRKHACFDFYEISLPCILCAGMFVTRAVIHLVAPNESHQRV